MQSLKFLRSGFLTFVVLIGLTRAARVVSAQQPATVSRELAEAFIRGYAAPDSLERVTFVEGQIPANLQSFVHLPDGARLLGTVALSRSSYVLVMSSLPPDSAFKAVAREYGRAGWPGLAQIRSTQTANPALGGFRQPAPTVVTDFCNDTVEVNVFAARVPGGETEIRLRVGRALRCPRPGSVPPRVTQTATPQLPLPRLLDPPASSPLPQCYVYGPSQSTSTLLSTTMAPAALADHYGRQMESQGWTLVTPEDPAARRVWTRRDSAGVVETATLEIQVSPNAPNCRNASLQVTTLRNP